MLRCKARAGRWARQARRQRIAAEQQPQRCRPQPLSLQLPWLSQRARVAILPRCSGQCGHLPRPSRVEPWCCLCQSNQRVGLPVAVTQIAVVGRSGSRLERETFLTPASSPSLPALRVRRSSFSQCRFESGRVLPVLGDFKHDQRLDLRCSATRTRADHLSSLGPWPALLDSTFSSTSPAPAASRIANVSGQPNLHPEPSLGLAREWRITSQGQSLPGGEWRSRARVRCVKPARFLRPRTCIRAPHPI